MKQTVVTTRIIRRSVKSMKFTTLTLADNHSGGRRIGPKNGEAVLVATVLSAMMWTTLGWMLLA